jgi:hypothetical protein
MQGSKVKGPEGVTWNETVGTNPQQREAHPDHSANQAKEKRKTELLDFQEAVTGSQGDGATLPFSAFDPCI